jgi:hypothetical protein
MKGHLSRNLAQAAHEIYYANALIDKLSVMGGGWIL